MAKITFILGLCASGKTYRAEELKKQTKSFLLDEGFFPPDDPPFSSNYKKIIQHLNNGEDCIVIEIMLCFEEVRKKVENILRSDVDDLEIKWICIENDLVQANRNIEYRKNKKEKGSSGHLKINKHVSHGYTYPKSCEVVPIFRP